MKWINDNENDEWLISLRMWMKDAIGRLYKRKKNESIYCNLQMIANERKYRKYYDIYIAYWHWHILTHI